jgi:hypothetical protein
MTDRIFFPERGGHNPVRFVTATIPADYTAGDRFTVAHGLVDDVGAPLAPAGVIPVQMGADEDDTITAVHVVFVKADATNVTFRSDGAEGDTFAFIVW